MKEQSYLGHIEVDQLKGPEVFIPSLRRIIAVVGAGMSDIGKGWTTAALASLSENPAVIKYDPMLNVQFPSSLGINLDGAWVSEDFISYEELGLKPDQFRNILGGQVLREMVTLAETEPHTIQGHVRKMTVADQSTVLADMITEAAREIQPSDLIIEVGGIITDREKPFLPDALRRIAIQTGITPEIVLVTYFDQSEATDGSGMNRLKTQTVRQGIRDTEAVYKNLPLKAVLVRKKTINGGMDPAKLQTELGCIAYETDFDPSKIFIIPNVSNLRELPALLKQIPALSNDSDTTLVSSCKLGIPCRYNGESRNLNPEQSSGLAAQGNLIATCPEVLGGLPTPRGPFHIEGGNGYDVLDGKARVIGQNGQDVTEQFIHGALKVLKIARLNQARKANFQEGSPSCNPNNSDNMIGVTAALLERWGVEFTS